MTTAFARVGTTGIGVTVAIAVLTLTALTTAKTSVRPSDAAPAPRLVDQAGRAFTLMQLRGTPLVVTFVSAHCANVCPLIDAQVARAVAAAHADRIAVRFLTLTLDPERDSAADMRALARTFGAQSPGWVVATGSSPSVHAEMRAFGVTAIRGADGYADAHSTFVYLVNRSGSIARTMLASTDMSAQIVDALRDDRVALAR